VYDLFGRIKKLERRDRSWPGADTASLLCEWFAELGVDPDSDPRDYAPAGSYASPEGTVYRVQRQTVDGLYLFVDPDQAAEYAALFEDAETSPETIIGRSAAAQLIIDNQPCPECGDPDGCGPCPAGDRAATRWTASGTTAAGFRSPSGAGLRSPTRSVTPAAGR
jgi:hypothetical protein